MSMWRLSFPIRHIKSSQHHGWEFLLWTYGAGVKTTVSQAGFPTDLRNQSFIIKDNNMQSTSSGFCQQLILICADDLATCQVWKVRSGVLLYAAVGHGVLRSCSLLSTALSEAGEFLIMLTRSVRLYLLGLVALVMSAHLLTLREQSLTLCTLSLGGRETTALLCASMNIFAYSCFLELLIRETGVDVILRILKW